MQRANLKYFEVLVVLIFNMQALRVSCLIQEGLHRLELSRAQRAHATDV